MLARILPLLALIVLAFISYWMWSQGTFNRIFNPSVVVAVAKREIVEGQVLSATYIEAKTVPLAQIKPGMFTYPEGTDGKEIAKSVTGQVALKAISRGTFLTPDMLGKSRSIVVLRAKKDVAEGGSLTSENVIPGEVSQDPLPGSIVFTSREEALNFMRRAYDLTALRPINTGQILTVEDTAGKMETIFTLRATGDLARGERLSMGVLESTESKAGSLKAGAITFRTRAAADIFITQASRFALSESVAAGEMLSAQMLSTQIGDAIETVGDVPQTLGELTAYMKAYPGRARLIAPGEMLFMSEPSPGDMIDIWIEKQRSSGAFGQITLTRVARDVELREVVKSKEDIRKERAAQDAEKEALSPAEAMTPADATGSGAQPDAIGAPTEDALPEDPKEARFLWIEQKTDVAERFDRVRANGKIAFMIPAADSIIELLGNGASCLEDTCTVDRTASDDLAHVVDEISTKDTSPDAIETASADPLVVLDGVGPDLEQRLRANGYASFEIIANWADADLAAIAIQLDISDNLAAYIREQARFQIRMADEAARELGFEEKPKE